MILRQDQPLKPFLEKHLPQFIVEDYALFASFLKAYAEWIDLGQGHPDLPVGQTLSSPREALVNIMKYVDADHTPADFLEYLREQYIKNLPKNIITDKRLVLKHSKDLFKAKGSENSFKFIFRLLYGMDSEVYYPKDDIMKTSSNPWIVETIVVLNSGIGNYIFDKTNELLYKDANNYAVIESAVGNGTVFYVSVRDLVGKFSSGDTVEFSTDGTDVGGDGLYGTVVSTISDISIDNGGINYAVGDPLVFTGVTGAEAYVSEVDEDGMIVSITTVCSGYNASSPSVVSVDGGGSGAAITLTAGGSFTKGGYFLKTADSSSKGKYLPDGHYYQEFSYATKLAQALDDYKILIKRMLHPAGMKLWGHNVTIINT